MNPQDAALQSLRAAVQASPQNGALRQALADLLFSFARYEEAEREYRAAVQQSPESVPARLGLARAFLQQSKVSAAAVLMEELLRRPDVPAAAHIVQARV